MKKKAISGSAFATLLLIAVVMGANHVAARVAFDHGTNVVTAVFFRSVVTALVVTVILYVQRVPVQLSWRHIKVLPIIGFLVAIQGFSVYSAVARLPVSLALLAFNTYPLWIVLWSWVFYGQRPEPFILKTMPVMLFGLALALDVFGAASGLGALGQWEVIGAGVAFALLAGATFGLAMVLIQNEAADLDGRIRTVSTMWIVGLLALIGAQTMSDFQWPTDMVGWWGLGLLTILFGTGFTIMLTVLPRLGVAANSAILNIEPICALVLGWFILGQHIALIQLIGAGIVLGLVIKIGLRKNQS